MTVALSTEAPALDFRVESVGAVEHAVVPTLVFRLGVDAGGRDVRALALNVQIRIDARRRAYDADERERLFELFGPPEAWDRALRSLRWTTTSLMVPPFAAEANVELEVPCTYDFEVAAAKYLHALGDGDAPVELLFSGTIFYAVEGGGLRVAQIPWDREARCLLPVRVWREALERAFPGTAWLRVRRDLFERLRAFKSERALPTWDAALEELLPDA